MVDKKELIFVVDEFDTPLKPMPRHKVKKEGHWFRAVHVWITNSRNQILVQKRSLKKDQGPGKWEPAVAGHIGPKDNYFTGAVREVNEETGLNIKETDLDLVKIYKDNEFREYRGIFVCKVNAEIRDIKSEEDEVDMVKLLSLNTLKKYLRSDKSDNWIRHAYEREILSILN